MTIAPVIPKTWIRGRGMGGVKRRGWGVEKRRGGEKYMGTDKKEYKGDEDGANKDGQIEIVH